VVAADGRMVCVSSGGATLETTFFAGIDVARVKEGECAA
jgi:hypothetical protein